MSRIPRLIIILLLFSTKLIFGQICEKTDTIVLFETTELENELKKESIFSSILDTLSSTKIYRDYVWIINEEIKKDNQGIELQLLLDQGLFWDDCKISYRNVYSIDISIYDSVYIESEITTNIDTLGESIREFILNPEDKEYLPIKKWNVINHFDSVLLTRHGFIINAVMIADSNGLSSSWHNLNSILNSIFISYLQLRNELSISEWKESFAKLDLEKQIAITQYYPIRIWIYPNRHLVKPPPPPEPPKGTEILNIIDIDDIIIEEVE